MASHARDLLNFRYFKEFEGQKDKAEEFLKEERKKNSSKIHYVVSASKVTNSHMLICLVLDLQKVDIEILFMLG